MESNQVNLNFEYIFLFFRSSDEKDIYRSIGEPMMPRPLDGSKNRSVAFQRVSRDDDFPFLTFSFVVSFTKIAPRIFCHVCISHPLQLELFL